jgi:hypothetical protein
VADIPSELSLAQSHEIKKKTASSRSRCLVFAIIPFYMPTFVCVP